MEDLKAKMLIRKAEQAEKERKEAKANEVCSALGWLLFVVDSKKKRSGVCYFN